VALGALLVATACGDATFRGDWQLVLDPDIPPDAIDGIEAHIRQGSCAEGNGAPEVYGAVLRQAGIDRAARSPGRLEPRLHAFSAVVYDEDCVPLGSGCREALLGGGDITVRIEVVDTPGLPPACSAASCGEGICDQPDAGLPDAGRDAGPGADAGEDSGPGTDAGEDAGPGMDAGFDAGPPPIDAGNDAGSCVATGSMCGSNGSCCALCCTGYCNGGGYCLCRTPGMTCSRDIECCPAGTCVGGFCER
jgi:hypothetical protein